MASPSSSPTLTRTVAPTTRAAGFLGGGMLDWPGKVSATLFLSGCNLRCPFCHNAELACGNAADPDSTWRRFADYVRTHRSWIDGVVVSGGEPTDDPALPALLRVLKTHGLPVRVDTNGTRPGVLAGLIRSGLVDTVAMDVKATPERYAAATGRSGSWAAVERSIELITTSGIDHEFRTTCYPGSVALEDLPHIARRLARAQRYVLQQFRPGRALDPVADTVQPHEPEALRLAARACSEHVPTTTRGV